jgi:hypothetical protein
MPKSASMESSLLLTFTIRKTNVKATPCFAIASAFDDDEQLRFTVQLHTTELRVSLRLNLSKLEISFVTPYAHGRPCGQQPGPSLARDCSHRTVTSGQVRSGQARPRPGHPEEQSHSGPCVGYSPSALFPCGIQVASRLVSWKVRRFFRVGSILMGVLVEGIPGLTSFVVVLPILRLQTSALHHASWAWHPGIHCRGLEGPMAWPGVTMERSAQWQGHWQSMFRSSIRAGPGRAGAVARDPAVAARPDSFSISLPKGTNWKQI